MKPLYQFDSAAGLGGPGEQSLFGGDGGEVNIVGNVREANRNDLVDGQLFDLVQATIAHGPVPKVERQPDVVESNRLDQRHNGFGLIDELILIALAQVFRGLHSDAQSNVALTEDLSGLAKPCTIHLKILVVGQFVAAGRDVDDAAGGVQRRGEVSGLLELRNSGGKISVFAAQRDRQLEATRL